MYKLNNLLRPCYEIKNNKPTIIYTDDKCVTL